MMNKMQYLLLKLIEESAEIQQNTSKCMQFGFTGEYEGETNLERLYAELDDFMASVDLLNESDCIFNYQPNLEAVDAKRSKVNHFFGVSVDMGYVDAS